MSPLGWRKFLFFGGNYYPEVFFVALAFAAAVIDPAKTVHFFTRKFILISAAIAFALLFLGFAMHGNFIAAWSDFRCIIALAVAAYFVKTYSDEKSDRYILVALISSLIGFLISSRLNLQIMDSSMKMAFAILAVVGSVYICSRRSWYIGMLAAISIGAILAVESFFRQNYLIMLLCVLSAAFSITANPRLRLINRLYISGVGIAAATFISYLEKYVSAYVLTYFQSSDSRYIHSIGKTREVLAMLSGSGNASQGDAIRLSYFQMIGDNTAEFLLPGGLGQSVLINKWRSLWMPPQETIIGSSLDGGHLYMSAHMGLILSGAIVILLARKWISALASLSIGQLPVFLLSSISVLVFFLFSSPFSQMSLAISFGACVGLLLRR